MVFRLRLQCQIQYQNDRCEMLCCEQVNSLWGILAQGMILLRLVIGKKFHEDDERCHNPTLGSVVKWALKLIFTGCVLFEMLILVHLGISRLESKRIITKSMMGFVKMCV